MPTRTSRKPLPPLLPLLGALSLAFAAWSISRNAPVRVEAAPLTAPPTRPSIGGAVIAGVGLVEPASETIALAPHIPGVVSAVHVRPGDAVEKGAPVFTIEDSEMRRQLAVAEAQVRLEKARLDKLLSLPRREDLPPVEARLAAARAENAEAATRYESRQRVGGRFVAPEEIEIARQGLNATAARMEEASASLALMRAGAWQPEIEQQRAALEAARAEAARAAARLALHTVRAPISGTVLRVDIRAGEYAAAASGPLVELGDLSTLHVRVAVDEEDLARLKTGAPATAFPRGDGAAPVRLEYVRAEPRLTAKRNLSGAANERIDTRVQEFIYKVGPTAAEDLTTAPVLPVGRQLDVFIEG